MGLNIVFGCETHRERLWVYRGHEADALLHFYDGHKDCAERNAIRLGDDQSLAAWVSDDRNWTAREFPEN